MIRTTWFRSTAALCAALALVFAWSLTLTGGTAGAVDEAASDTGGSRGGYDQIQLQRDLDAVRDAGAVGVLAEVGGRHPLRGTSGTADPGTAAPVAPDGYFRMGSTTKTFVAVVVLQLVAERRLSLDDTVEQWLPDLVAGNGNDGSHITVGQLLRHTSGLHNYTDDLVTRITSVEAYQQLRYETFTPVQLVAMATAQPPDFAPGQGWNYSNTNYVLLGMIVEKVSGRHWANEVERRVLRPLHLDHTFAPGVDTELPQPHPSAYLFLDPETPIETSSVNVSWTSSAGELVTTAPDLSRFWAALGRGALLPPAQHAHMRETVLATTWQEDEPGRRYGLGISWKPLSCGGGYWMHGGDVPGFSTVSGVSADGGKTVVVSMNVTADLPVHQAAWNLVDHAMCGRAGGQ